MSSKTKFLRGFATVIFLFIFSNIILLWLDATKSDGSAIVGAANIVGAFGVVIAIISTYAQNDQAKAQRYYDLMERYIDDDFKIAERYLKTRFEVDMQAKKFYFFERPRNICGHEGAYIQSETKQGDRVRN